MMELSGLALVVMVVMMVAMCGGMVFGAGWAWFHRHGRSTGPD
jgi:hypothetical protein